MSNKKIQETAVSGSVSAHSIAVKTDGAKDDFPLQRRGGSFLDFIGEFNSKIQNRVNMKPVKMKKPFSRKLKENVSLDQIYSKLSGIRNQGRMESQNATTYGVEDDDGNLMKITVRGDQAEKFEVALAQELGELENYKMTGRGGQGRDVSIAEILYNLKQEFDIITVEFPEIPSNKVYNADKVSDPEDVKFGEEEFSKGSMDGMDFSDEEELDMDTTDTEDEDEPGDDLGDLEGEEDQDLETPDEEDLGVEFEEDAGESDASSLLKNIVQMLTKQAEAQAAEAEAEAEKSRALQAEYSFMAAKEEMAKQTELAKMERELEAQKNKEKEAKKMADLARHQLRSVSEGGSFLGALTDILEYNNMELRYKKRQANRIEDPQEKRLELQHLNAERRLGKYRSDRDEEEKRKEKELEDDERRGVVRPDVDNSRSTIYDRGRQQ